MRWRWPRGECVSLVPMSDRGLRDAKRRRRCEGVLRSKRALGRYDGRETDPGGKRNSRGRGSADAHVIGRYDGAMALFMEEYSWPETI
jgi:hypothetical protein